jgi:hypothetical protein
MLTRTASRGVAAGTALNSDPPVALNYALRHGEKKLKNGRFEDILESSVNF